MLSVLLSILVLYQLLSYSGPRVMTQRELGMHQQQQPWR